MPISTSNGATESEAAESFCLGGSSLRSQIEEFRKRVKTIPINSWKLAKIETNSSPSTDENSNGVTPNLDAPKMCHNRIASYRHLDSTLSSENNTIIGSPNISHIEPECSNANHQHCNNNNNNTLDSFGDESKQTLQLQQCQSKNVDKVLPQYRKVAIFGVGAGSSSSSASASQPNVTNSNSNSPSAGRSTRSPLATVSGNNHNRTVRNASQHESIGGNGIATINNSTNPNPILYASNYMPMPSTSKQITIIKQQQRQQLQQQQLQRQVQNLSQHQQKQKPNEQHPHMALYDNFFLFRQQQLRDHVNDGKDHFSSLSDEIILQIFKWLPKKKR
ncbi:myb-like protein I [Rhagoletis pomonella]|uniref:myb-like protein I n=1 Tax=Rhagoletis pomonella TaxID=28610 RepID=UPI00177D3D11|nr:myb-like protein I [Rhagoletis pomonella]